jgi:8-oxo-dGTP pyrophosphatase MutT (NUDIX family)
MSNLRKNRIGPNFCLPGRCCFWGRPVQTISFFSPAWDGVSWTHRGPAVDLGRLIVILIAFPQGPDHSTGSKTLVTIHPSKEDEMAHVYEPELVYLVQEQGNGVSLGELVDHKWADETPGVEHACVYIAVVNSGGEIYIQHRAGTKRLWPNCKTISVSGHVDPGETFEQAGVRETREELGIAMRESDLRLLGSFTGLSHCGRVYEFRSDVPPRPGPAELDVRRSGFVAVAELGRLLSEPGLFTPSGARALGIWMSRLK